MSHDTITIDDGAIARAIANAATPSESQIAEIIAKGRTLNGLSREDVAVLLNVHAPEHLSQLFEAARYVKETIYGKRLVIFSPLYISNLCQNECTYCAFRVRNKSIARRALTQPEIESEVQELLRQGHKRILLVAGESYPKQGFQYVLDAIHTIYEARADGANIRRVNVNVAPLSVEEFKNLAQAKIGTYQLFQETYHRDTYKSVHIRGQKADYDYRLSAIDRAMTAGIEDVGIGVLFGLSDYRYEILAMLAHIQHLEDRFGVGPHTISVPRLEPASGSEIATHPPQPVSDLDFQKIVAILRLAVPYTGIIMSTRETAHIRRETFALGVSQISAGSRTTPGGYANDSPEEVGAQFSLGDHRSLDEVIRDVASLGYIPSFCTGCYRLGRVGQDFMDLARPGDIKHHCDPNAFSTFLEYLLDYAAETTRQQGLESIEKSLATLEPEPRRISERLMEQVRQGKRDVFC
ncbi:MAG: [FeFe] hydrogenase H-cluster radical SAM maturase HydG [Proteobacteria bacterium]|nr:[FeFe] hydrogenase H-cluster radical SAM maturase HydG [Pseudomonadota bacterium]